MEKPQNKYISLTYKLYTIGDDGKKELVEEATEERPFLFISGFGIALESFEQRTLDLAKDDNFEFELTKDEAYGDYDPAQILDLDRGIFSINGHFDHEHIYKDAIVPLQNEDGHKFYGRVIDLNEDKVKMDMNHPLAGKNLHFEGKVLENREATNSEIESLVNHLGGEDCDCGCDHDHCGCDHDHKGHDHCGCDHDHEGHDHCCHHNH